MERLENPIAFYAWGSTTALPSLLNKPPDGRPQAELWLGAHPSAPSKVPSGATLEAIIAASPQRLLGEACLAQFGPRLPYLLKVLAAAQPLSLQAHPSRAQAQAGFAREEARGVPRGAPERNYKDTNHKPEIICALSTFQALCGFRRSTISARLWDALGLESTVLKEHGLRAYFEQLMTLPKAAQGALVDQLVSSAQRPVEGFEAECRLAVRLGALYPQDVGVMGALLLNLVTLQPGEALYLDAGNLHAYLEGTGVELMASSDNVLRGGLTPKHVDVGELLAVLNFVDGPAQVLRPVGQPESVYVTPAPDFRLSRVEVIPALPVTLAARGPQVLLVTEGEVIIGGQRLRQGDSVFLGADEGEAMVSGHGTLYRATTGLPTS